MTPSRSKLLLSIAAALVVSASLVWLVGRSPSAAPQAEEAALSPLDTKVQKAFELIQGGSENPMEAIMLLREVVQEDSNHRDAHFWLGEFSVQSGQMDKAVERFRRVVSLDPAFAPGVEKLATVYLQLGQADSADAVVHRFLDRYPQAEGADRVKALHTEHPPK